MNEKPRVETVEEFKLRIAAIMHGKVQEIPPRAGRIRCLSVQTSAPLRVYEVRPRKDNRGADLISDVLPFYHRARVVFGCRIVNDPATMPSTIPARFTAHGAL